MNAITRAQEAVALLQKWEDFNLSNPTVLEHVGFLIRNISKDTTPNDFVELLKVDETTAKHLITHDPPANAREVLDCATSVLEDLRNKAKPDPRLCTRAFSASWKRPVRKLKRAPKSAAVTPYTPQRKTRPEREMYPSAPYYQAEQIQQDLKGLGSPEHIGLFSQGVEVGYLKRIKNNQDERSRLRFRPFTESSFRAFTDRRIKYTKTIEKKDGPETRPFPVSHNCAAQALDSELSWTHHAAPLEKISPVPTFGKDWTLYDRSGYVRDLKTYLDLPEDMEGIGTRLMSVDEAHAVFDDLVGEFEFEDEDSRANWFGALLWMVLPVKSRPLVVLDAPKQGCGKSILAQLIAHIAGDSEMYETAVKTDDETEFEKGIGTALAEQKRVVIFDNLPTTGRPFNSTSLASCLTVEQEFSTRKLGSSESIKASKSAMPLFALTGVNVRLHNDLYRRSILVRLDPKVEDPSARKNFKYTERELKDKARNDRALYVRACLSLVAHWVQCGAPMGSVSRGSFVAGSRIVSGILECTGFEGTLFGNTEKLRASTSEDTEGICELLEIMRNWQAGCEEDGQAPNKNATILRLDTDPVPQGSKKGKRATFIDEDGNEQHGFSASTLLTLVRNSSFDTEDLTLDRTTAKKFGGWLRERLGQTYESVDGKLALKLKKGRSRANYFYAHFTPNPTSLN